MMAVCASWAFIPEPSMYAFAQSMAMSILFASAAELTGSNVAEPSYCFEKISDSLPPATISDSGVPSTVIASSVTYTVIVTRST